MELPVKLIVIGVIEDITIFNEIKDIVDQEGLPVEFFTSPEYTKEASRFLYLADAVFGTGRGAMEAMSMGLPVFAPLKDRDYPGFINEKTFDSLLDRNFSGRGEIDFYTNEELLNDTKKLVTDKQFYIVACEYSLSVGRKYFLITEEVKEKYFTIYKNLKLRKRKDLIRKNIIAILYYLNVYRKVSKRQPNLY